MEGTLAPPPRRARVVLGVCGSVAAVKWEEIALALLPWADVRVVHTSSALPLAALSAGYAPRVHESWAAAAAAAGLLSAAPGASASLPSPSAPLALLCDAAEWRGYGAVGTDPVVHIELRKWADALLVAPCSANTLAKLAGGLADNLLTCIARAWEFAPVAGNSGNGEGIGSGGCGSCGDVRSGVSDVRSDADDVLLRVAKPLLVAPAMNTAMWAHPATRTHLGVLRSWGVTIVPPVSKQLACGDVGNGALAAVPDIVAALRAALPASCCGCE